MPSVANIGGCGDITSPYQAARVNRLNSHWTPQHFSGDEAIRQSWNLMTARIRDRVRGDSLLVKAKDTLQRLIIGTGIRAYSDASCMVEDSDESERLIQYEIESDLWFDRWALNEFDAQGEFSFYEMQRTAIGDEVEGGNALWLQISDDSPNRTVPLAYQLLEWEQVDMSQDRDLEVARNGSRLNRISNGIEFDAKNQKVAFHLFDAHPYDSSSGWTTKSTRIPAWRVVHQYTPSRPSARLGVTWFAPMMQTSHDLDRFVANELTARALAALLAIAIKSDDPGFQTGLEADDCITGVRNHFRMGYPYIGTLKRTDEIQVVESKNGTGDSETFRNLLLNLSAMGCRISMTTLLGDAHKSNMAGVKAANQQDDETVAPVQESVAHRVVQRIRHEHTRVAIGTGLLRTVKARDYERRQWQYNQCSNIASNRADPDKDDGEASIDRLRAGLSTYPDECARRGRHWRRNLMLMSTVNREAERRGVVLDWSKGNGGVPTGSTSNVPVEEESVDGKP